MVLRTVFLLLPNLKILPTNKSMQPLMN